MRVKQHLLNHPIIPKFTICLDIDHQYIAGWWLFYQPVLDDPRCLCLLHSHWCASAHSTMTAEANSCSFFSLKKPVVWGMYLVTWWDWNGVIEMFAERCVGTFDMIFYADTFMIDISETYHIHCRRPLELRVQSSPQNEQIQEPFQVGNGERRTARTKRLDRALITLWWTNIAMERSTIL